MRGLVNANMYGQKPLSWAQPKRTFADKRCNTSVCMTNHGTICHSASFLSVCWQGNDFCSTVSKFGFAHHKLRLTACNFDCEITVHLGITDSVIYSMLQRGQSLYALLYYFKFQNKIALSFGELKYTDVSSFCLTVYHQKFRDFIT